MKPFANEPILKTGVVLGAVALLAGFFVFPWALDWGRAGTILRFDNPAVFGESAYDIATYAPVLWLVPVGALVIATIALVPWMTSRQPWQKWALMLLVAFVVLYPQAWIVDALNMRTLAAPALKNEWPGTIYFAWKNNPELANALVEQHHDVLAGEPYPDYGYRISVPATGVIMLCSLAGLLQTNIMRAERRGIQQLIHS